MRILVIDSNIVYAKRVKTALECFVHSIEVDLANDVFVTQRRLRTNKYDLIIVDIQTIANQELMLEELKNTSIPSIAWTALPHLTYIEKQQLGEKIKSIKKPLKFDDFEFQEAAIAALTTARAGSSSGFLPAIDKIDDANIDLIR